MAQKKVDMKSMEDMLKDDAAENQVDGAEDDDSIEDETFFEKHRFKIFATIFVVVVLIIGVIIFIVTRPEPPPPPPPAPLPAPTPDPWLEEQRRLIEAGIGAYYIDEAAIFQQGNIETFTFRQDFAQIDQPEAFALPISIATARDSMQYTRHRAVTAVGVEVYWLEGNFRGRRVVTTIPYALYQIIPASGVISIEVEVVTDANGSLTITYVRPLPPTQLQRR